MRDSQFDRDGLQGHSLGEPFLKADRARGVLLVGIPKSGNGPNEYDWDYAEVPVSYLIQF